MPIVKIEFTAPDPGGGPEQRSPGALVARGPLLPLTVGPALAPGQPLAPHPSDKTVAALIDTGATESCIDESLAKHLSLKVIDRVKVGGVAGQKTHNVYLGRLMVPALNLSMSGRLIGVNLGADVPVIIGRDFLANLIMIYDGTEGCITLAV